MKLHEYLITNNLSPAQFANLLKLKSRSSVHRYLEGQIPKPENMRRIFEVTNGLVTLHDFLDDREDAIARTRCKASEQDNLPYPWSRRERELEASVERRLRRMLLQEPSEGSSLSRPLQSAVGVLGNRVWMDKEKQNFKLDGRVVDAREIVTQANKILESQGQEPILYPGVCPLEQ